jgi:plasmid stability protein
MESAVSLSIKNVPAQVAKALASRASRNHRSLQGELMHILEAAVQPVRFDAARIRRRAEALGLMTDADSVQIVRDARDSR